MAEAWDKFRNVIEKTDTKAGRILGLGIVAAPSGMIASALGEVRERERKESGE